MTKQFLSYMKYIIQLVPWFTSGTLELS